MSRWTLTIIAMLLGSLADPAVTSCAAQLYLDPYLAKPSRQVSTWPRSDEESLLVTVIGDLALAGWHSRCTAEPALSMTRLSTGETLWTMKAEQGALQAWFLNDVVLVGVSDGPPGSELSRLEWRDTQRGTVMATRSLPNGSRSLIVLKTVVVEGREVLDQRTGQERGRISDHLWSGLYEHDSQIVGIRTIAPGAAELVVLDVGDGSELKRSPMPDKWDVTRTESILGHTPILSDGARLIFADHLYQLPARDRLRTVAAFDIEEARFLWRIEVPQRAPLLFVHDLDADLPPLDGCPIPPLLIDWQSGATRPHPQLFDRAVWTMPNLPPHTIRQARDTRVLFGVADGVEMVVGVDDHDQLLWRSEFPPLQRRAPSLPLLSRCRFSQSEDFAVIPAAGSFEILNLRTGTLDHVINIRTVGLPPPERPSQRPSPVPTAPPKLSVGGWDLLPVLFAAALFGVYLGVRNLMSGPMP